MKVHCSVCDLIADVSTQELQASFVIDDSLLGLVEGDIPNTHPTIPYDFYELAAHLKESLPFWKIEIIKQGKDEILKLTCHKHLEIQPISNEGCKHYICPCLLDQLKDLTQYKKIQQSIKDEQRLVQFDYLRAEEVIKFGKKISEPVEIKDGSP